MLKINGKEVIYSKTFVMNPRDEVLLKVPEIIGRDIRIEINGTVTQHAGTTTPFGTDESDVHLSILKVPFADAGAFFVEYQDGQLSTQKGRVNCRIAGHSLGATAMLLQIDLHEGRYDNYVEN